MRRHDLNVSREYRMAVGKNVRLNTQCIADAQFCRITTSVGNEISIVLSVN